MKSKMIGATLLIIGTSLGSGLLALPMATAGLGFLHSIWLFLCAWSAMTFGAFYILEVNMALPEHSNMVSMAKATLGNGGRLVTWVVYLLLLYALLSAYIAGGSDLVTQLFGLIHWQIPQWMGGIIFVVIFGGIVHCGIRMVDRANRLLMTVKMSAYVFLVALVIPRINLPQLTAGNIGLLGGAVMVVFTSFGYATIIPSLRSYFNSQIKPLRIVIGVGSLIPLVCYLLWVLVVQGSVGRDNLMQMANSAHAVTTFTTSLSAASGSAAIGSIAHLFTVICITTSFLGVALCLWDFLADGLKLNNKSSSGRWRSTLLTLSPPLIIVIFWPGIFVKALAYAGVICIVLLMLLPGLMAWSSRYWKKTAGAYQVWGGRGILAAEIILSTGLAIYGLFEVLK